MERRRTLRPGQISRADGAVLCLLPRTIRHMAAHRDVTFDLLRMAFERAQLPADSKLLKAEIDFGRIIGRTSKVQTQAVDSDDLVPFAYRHGRRYPSRVAIGLAKPTTSLFTLVAEHSRATEEAVWTLETAYLGSYAPLEPLGNRVLRSPPEFQAMVTQFWCRHALVYDPDEYVTTYFVSSWSRLRTRRIELGPEGFPEGGPYWMGDEG